MLYIMYILYLFNAYFLFSQIINIYIYISYIFLLYIILNEQHNMWFLYMLYICIFCIYVFFCWLFMKNANYSLRIYSSHQMCLKSLFISHILKLKHPILSKIYITYILFLYFYLYATPCISGSSRYIFSPSELVCTKLYMLYSLFSLSDLLYISYM